MTNNEAEYEALILGLELASQAGAKDLEVFTDSQLIALQIEGTYETREKTMTSYKEIAQQWMKKFDKCSVLQVPRTENDKADALSKFGATMDGIGDRKITVLVRGRPCIASRAEVQTIRNPNHGRMRSSNISKMAPCQPTPSLQRELNFEPLDSPCCQDKLYKRTVDEPLLKCLDEERALYVMREIHEGSCGNHSGARSLAQKIIRQGFYWPTMAKDSKELVKKCESCQKYATLIHQPATPMEPLKIACPFDQWGIDIVGPFPLAQAQKKFIIVAVEYFTKWVEAEAVARISEREVINFIWKNIICRFGLPRVLISDNGTQFQGRKITEWSKELKIAQHFTAVTNPQANGQTEDHAMNRNRGDPILPGVWDGSYHPSSDRRRVPKSRNVGDLVLKKVEASKHVGKLEPPWEGSFKVVELKRKGTYRLQDMQGRNLPRPWNIQNLKMFYA
ncbi:UNVERIFIED_CONTAM: Gag-Pol polyprotein [Sesamum indicum]